MNTHDGEEAEPGIPIHRIRMPEMQLTSTKIRWLRAMGYSVKEIASFLGLRYQQVRNVSTQYLKRGAREELPPLVLEVVELHDDISALLDTELRKSLLEGQKELERAKGKHRRMGARVADKEGSYDVDDENFQG